MLNKVVNCRQLLSLNFTGRSLAIMVSFMNIITVALPSPAPDDWTSNLHLSEDNRGSDTFMSAYINVSYMNKNEWIWDRSEEGRYGSGDVRPAYGVIVHVTADDNPNDHTGCQLPFRSTRSDRRLPDPGEPWVALIKRGKCNFEVKVDNAYRSFAAGVIIYNDRDSDSLDKMKLTTDSGRKYIFSYFSYFLIRAEILGAKQCRKGYLNRYQNRYYFLSSICFLCKHFHIIPKIKEPKHYTKYVDFKLLV